MITKLLEVRGKKPGKNVQLSEEDIKYLCTTAREWFISQPNLLELEAPIKICGKLSNAIFNALPVKTPLVSVNDLTRYPPTWTGCVFLVFFLQSSLTCDILR